MKRSSKFLVIMAILLLLGFSCHHIYVNVYCLGSERAVAAALDNAHDTHYGLLDKGFYEHTTSLRKPLEGLTEAEQKQFDEKLRYYFLQLAAEMDYDIVSSETSDLCRYAEVKVEISNQNMKRAMEETMAELVADVHEDKKEHKDISRGQLALDLLDHFFAHVQKVDPIVTEITIRAYRPEREVEWIAEDIQSLYVANAVFGNLFEVIDNFESENEDVDTLIREIIDSYAPLYQPEEKPAARTETPVVPEDPPETPRYEDVSGDLFPAKVTPDIRADVEGMAPVNIVPN